MTKYTKSKRERVAEKHGFRYVGRSVISLDQIYVDPDIPLDPERVRQITMSYANPTAFAKLHLKVDEHCCFCNVHMTNVHETHNPYPLRSLEERCCVKCDEKLVFPARLTAINSKMKSMQT